ncbi:MAG: hypothetical protein AB9856_06595 [Cellulosilyticaceae bacterium]
MCCEKTTLVPRTRTSGLYDILNNVRIDVIFEKDTVSECASVLKNLEVKKMKKLEN